MPEKSARPGTSGSVGNAEDMTAAEDREPGRFLIEMSMFLPPE
jgi:hypothetical protein